MVFFAPWITYFPHNLCISEVLDLLIYKRVSCIMQVRSPLYMCSNCQHVVVLVIDFSQITGEGRGIDYEIFARPLYPLNFFLD